MTILVKKIMENNILDIISYVTNGFFIRQFLTIVFLTVYGLMIFTLTRGKMSWKWRYVLSFPTGLALYVVSALTVLILGVPFGSLSVLIVMILLLVITAALGKRSEREILAGFELKGAAVWTLLVLLLAILAVSGRLSLALSNDSVYYYSTYPRILIEQGGYAKSFDTYLTDVGQASAAINCLPFLFGFDTSFGIQHFLNFCFIISFGLFLYEREREMGVGKNKSVILSVAFTLFLASATPFLVISKWVLSNVYFMEYAFWISVFLMKLSKEEITADWSVMMASMMAVTAMLRMEGGIIALLIVFAASSFGYSSKRIAVNFLLPMLIFEAGYYIRLFSLGVDPLYSFLDWKKAVLMVGMIAAAMLYMLIIRGRYMKFVSNNIRLMMIAALIAGNIGLCFINKERFINNLYAFYQNLRQGNGWGIFGIYILLAAVLIVWDTVWGRFSIEYSDAVLAAFVLAVVAVCWARGGMLVVRTSDSGNRVLLEIVPFVIWVLHEKILKKVEKNC